MLRGIQYLRFLAVLMVVIGHAFQETALRNPNIRHFNIGAIGVDIFFVISGFIMVIITEGRERSASDFLLHRITRVVPPYWLIMFAMLAVTSFNPSHALASFFFIPAPHPNLIEMYPLYRPGWTMNCEFYFYSIFAISMAINHCARILIASVIMVSVISLHEMVPEHSIPWFYSNSIMVEFIFGMAIGYFYTRRPTTKTAAIAAITVSLIWMGAVSAITVQPFDQFRFAFWGAPSALLVFGLLRFETNGLPESRALLFGGNASYSIYLTHFLVAVGLAKLMTSLNIPALLVVGSIIIASLAVGGSFHILVEKPLIRLARILASLGDARRPRNI